MENVSVEKIEMGSKEYLKIVPAYSNMIVNYQLLMITGNKIPGLLEVSRRQNNDEVALLYDITDKKSLSDILGERKLKKQELLKVIEAIVKADSNGRSYQLANKGIIIDPEYIFFEKNKPEVRILYLPVFDADAEPSALNDMIKSMIMDGKIENTNDNFLGTLIDVLNKDNFSYRTLGEFLRRFSRGNSTQDRNPVREKPESRPEHDRKPKPGDPPYSGPNIPPVKTRTEGTSMGRNADNQFKGVQQEPEKEVKNGSSIKNVIFILAAAVVILLIGVLYTRGVFFVDGQLKPEYIGAAALAGGAVLFILYREMFVNNKDKTETQKKSADNINKDLPRKPVPGAKAVTMPQKTPTSKPEVRPKKTPKHDKEALPQKPPMPTAVQHKPSEVSKPYDMGALGFDEFDDNSDTVIIEGETDGADAYLEYYVNGISAKIPIDGKSIIVGKQKSRVNYSIPNKTISKVHAEFGIDSNGYYVKDYESTNGTFINDGNRLQAYKQYEIKNGDTIRLANLDLTFHC